MQRSKLDRRGKKKGISHTSEPLNSATPDHGDVGRDGDGVVIVDSCCRSERLFSETGNRYRCLV